MLSHSRHTCTYYSEEIKERFSAPWFDGEYKTLCIERRKSEIKWKKSKLESDQFEYHRLKKMFNALALEKKNMFYKNEFLKHNKSPKSLYNFVNMDKEKSLVLPPNDSLYNVVTEFNTFFQDKIMNIRNFFRTLNTMNQLKLYSRAINLVSLKSSQLRS